MDIQKNRQDPVLKTYVKLMRTTASVTQKLHEHLSSHRLTISQFGVLEALLHLGPMCQKDIGTKLLKTGGNITMVIDNLEKRELVQRRRDPEDRRFLRIHLTSKGQKLIQRIFPDHIRIARHLFSPLAPDELEQLQCLMMKLSGVSTH